MGRRALAGVAPVLGLALTCSLLAACGSGGTVAPRSPGELVNFRLGPDLSHWLVGPIARMATAEEAREYLTLASDLAAIDFIEGFWRRRDADPGDRDNPVRLTFERRAEEADRLYSEASILGRRTPRGTLHVLYGEPEEVEYEVAPEGGDPIVVWRYPPNAPAGLDGQAPNRFYWFRKQGDLTRPYRPGGRRPRVP